MQLAELGLQSWARAAHASTCRRSTADACHAARSSCRSADGTLAAYTLRARHAWPRAGGRDRGGIASRSPPRTSSPIRAPTSTRGSTAAIDWDATLAYRRHLWSQGFGVAEAMDTAQRGMGLDWPTSLELIRRTRRAKRATSPGAVVFSGAGTDHLPPDADAHARPTCVAAYDAQCAAIERAGGRIILMASRALAACARSPDDYVRRLRARAGAGAGSR